MIELGRHVAFLDAWPADCITGRQRNCLGFLRKLPLNQLTADFCWWYTFATLCPGTMESPVGIFCRHGAGQRRPPIYLAG